jgi:hypothetical protein
MRIIMGDVRRHWRASKCTTISCLGEATAMKNLFDPTRATELTERIERLRPDSPPLWGKMTAPQAMAHCAVTLEWAVGDTRAKRMMIGRVIGGMVKRRVAGLRGALAIPTPFLDP